MKEYIFEQMRLFLDEVSYIESSRLSLDEILHKIEEEIIRITGECYSCMDDNLKEELKFRLLRKYDLLYFFQSKKNGFSRMYLLSNELEKLPNIFLIDQKPKLFDIDDSLLAGIDISIGLTYEEAYELLKWTSNNTRSNISKSQRRSIYDEGDVYDNASLDSYCGFSQFSTLYPLQRMGLEVTINNVGSVCNVRHAFGTVVIPIRENGDIVNKRFLLDCTYRQFFTIPYNCVSRYFHSTPNIGFYINQKKEGTMFARELLENGFVEASEENLIHYLKPFHFVSFSVDELDFVDEKFLAIDIVDTLEKKQEEFHYDEDEFVSFGCNVKFPYLKNNRLT